MVVRSVVVAAVVVVVASILGSSLQSQHHELFVHSMRPCQQGILLSNSSR